MHSLHINDVNSNQAPHDTSGGSRPKACPPAGIQSHDKSRRSARRIRLLAAAAILVSAPLASCSQNDGGSASTTSPAKASTSPTTASTTAGSGNKDSGFPKDEVLCGVVPHKLVQQEMSLDVVEYSFANEDRTGQAFECILNDKWKIMYLTPGNLYWLNDDFREDDKNNDFKTHPNEWTSLTIAGREGQGSAYVRNGGSGVVWTYSDGSFLSLVAKDGYPTQLPKTTGMTKVLDHLIDTTPAFSRSAGRFGDFGITRTSIATFSNPNTQDAEPRPTFTESHLCGVVSKQPLEEIPSFAPTTETHSNYPMTKILRRSNGVTSVEYSRDFNCELKDDNDNKELRIKYGSNSTSPGVTLDNVPDGWERLDSQGHEGQGLVWHDDRIVRILWYYPNGDYLEVRLHDGDFTSKIDQASVNSLTNLTYHLVDNVPAYNQSAGKIQTRFRDAGQAGSQTSPDAG